MGATVMLDRQHSYRSYSYGLTSNSTFGTQSKARLTGIHQRNYSRVDYYADVSGVRQSLKR